MRTLFLPLLFFFALVNCSKSNSDKNSANAAFTPIIAEDEATLNKVSLVNAKTDNTPSSGSNKMDSISRKIIKNGNMRIQVGEIKKRRPSSMKF